MTTGRVGRIGLGDGALSCNGRGASEPSDEGTSFIEVLIAVVLLGLMVVTTLAALRTTIIATAIERDHSKAHEWLQSASEILASEDIAWADCDTPLTGAQIATTYQGALQAATGVVPEDWFPSQISVVGDVRFAQPSGDYGAGCVAPIDRQLVTIRVTDTEGKIVEQVDVVKAAP